MSWRDLLPEFADLTIQAITCDAAGIMIDLVSTRLHAACTTCQALSPTGHGGFVRWVQGLPTVGRSTRLCIHARRFRCLNPACPRRTFREDLAAIVFRYQRRTPELTRLFQGLGCKVGGTGGMRLARLLCLHTSRSTLVRITKRLALTFSTEPRVVGVDEFAWKKGRRYGTILVDREAHRVLALLPDRDVETVAAWFRAHPSILMVTRDLPPPAPTISSHQRESHQRRTRRQDRYEQSVVLHQRGWSNSAIARELGMHRDTIARYLTAEHFPERRNRPARQKAINQYLDYMHHRWAEGEHNGRRLYQEVRALGYRGGTTMVYEVIRPWRQHSPCLHQAKVTRTFPSYAPRQTTWLLVKSVEQQTPEEHAYVQAVLHSPSDIAPAFALIQRFGCRIRERDDSALGPWAQEAEHSGTSELVSFVQGLYRDWEAVEHALLYMCSQGQVEGSVNRGKLIKRQSYGCASPALLQARVVGARNLYPM